MNSSALQAFAALRARLSETVIGQPAVGEALRGEGHGTVAALSAADDAIALRCTHLWDGGALVSVESG